jgi:hypothetical protein
MVAEEKVNRLSRTTLLSEGIDRAGLVRCRPKWANNSFIFLVQKMTKLLHIDDTSALRFPLLSKLPLLLMLKLATGCRVRQHLDKSPIRPPGRALVWRLQSGKKGVSASAFAIAKFSSGHYGSCTADGHFLGPKKGTPAWSSSLLPPGSIRRFQCHQQDFAYT